MQVTDTSRLSEPLWNGPGIVVVDKPRGPSSHQVVAWISRMIGCRVGHSGTLDPQVSGLLLVMLGNAVRLAPLLLKHDKEYICLMRLHGDAGETRIAEVATEFTGRIYQRPPRKSAVKRSLRIRTIHELVILGIGKRLVLFRVRCDAGTYIRSLCHHIGLALGTGAHMQELRRTRSGTFSEEDMCTLHEIQDACTAARTGNRARLESLIRSVDTAVPELPVITIRDSAIDAVCHGAVLAGVGVLRCNGFKKGDTVAVLSEKGEFVCLGKARVPSSAFRPGDSGLVIAPATVFMAPGTYSKGWKTAKNGEGPEKHPPAKKIALKKTPANR